MEEPWVAMVAYERCLLLIGLKTWFLFAIGHGLGMKPRSKSVVKRAWVSLLVDMGLSKAQVQA